MRDYFVFLPSIFVLLLLLEIPRTNGQCHVTDPQTGNWYVLFFSLSLSLSTEVAWFWDMPFRR